MSDKTIYDLKLINRILDKCDNSMYSFVSDRLMWLKKFHRAPEELLDALILKASSTFSKSWYGDEPEEIIINRYLKI